jgi:hypothetical protein
VEFVELNFDFHPKAIRQWLTKLGFSIEKTLTLSHFRVGFLKRTLPTSVLVFFDSIFQWTGALWQFTPSVFVKAKRGKLQGQHGEETSPALANLSMFFKCPDCGTSPLIDHKDHLECTNCRKKWEYRDGIYDFREPIKN